MFVLLLALVATPAVAKSLHWRSLDVTARLDRDGRLQVVEKQAMVFDGDWNGGERTFRVAPGQSLHFESLSRLDDETARPLIEGDVSKVDHYKFTSPTVLRWRSRLPGDPEFQNQEITYLLQYSLSGVLRQTGGAFILNHDFAFPDRAGTIENFSLRLDFDPVWTGAHSPILIQRSNLTSGESVVVSLNLRFAGAGSPTAVVRTLPRSFGYAVLALLVVAIGYLIFDFMRTEKEKGRFAPLPPLDVIDETWLTEHLFVLKPEAAGAAMDGKTGAPEVAAMLARMTVEKKISSTVETRRSFLQSRQVLCLKLLVARDSLPPSEGKLVQAFFFNGDATDTDIIRDHYSGRGFDPAKIVEAGIAPELQHIKGWGKNPRRANWKQDGIALGGTLALLLVAALRGGNDTGVVIAVAIAGVVLLLAAGAVANNNSRAVTGFVGRFTVPALIIAPLLLLVVGYTRGASNLVLHVLTPLAICAWTVAVIKLLLDLLRSPESPARIEFRKNLHAARNYFIAELRSPTPRLRDDWYPYLLAFGLGNHVDRWFSAFGSNAGGAGAFTSGSSSSSSPSSSAPSFTGGGGNFGGAGASGGWAVAAAAMGAGVSAPSSGGGGGGGGGSSSGGGGGGGW